ncbi:hypothetical protein GA0070215_104169 [Micromonospora marina]|uniref:Uncharacterized protein n=1 Tax=Micromonospora marina TaxID=307120 RepID=A0A1C4W1X4_9ACTN|nr:hypothetical protein GA0070215_104169 [Micromonospora marina]
MAGLSAARARGLRGGRKPKMTPALIGKAQRMYDSRQFTMAEIATAFYPRPWLGTSMRSSISHSRPPESISPRYA